MQDHPTTRPRLVSAMLALDGYDDPATGLVHLVGLMPGLIVARQRARQSVKLVVQLYLTDWDRDYALSVTLVKPGGGDIPVQTVRCRWPRGEVTDSRRLALPMLVQFERAGAYRIALLCNGEPLIDFPLPVEFDDAHDALP